MLIIPSLNSLRSRIRSSPPQRGTRTPWTFQFSPQLESLDGRIVPSVIMVRTSADSGAGSLRDAIATATSGDTLVFDRHLSGDTISLSGELVITKNLTIAGLGADHLTISGSGVSRVFDIASGETLSLSKLAVTGGSADVGAGILNAGILALSQVTLSGNTALGDSGSTGLGGGIFNETNAVLNAV